jgi:hypothetical protein
LSWYELLLIPLGFAVSVYGTVVGSGGGFLLVPALLLAYPGGSQRELTSISLAVVLAGSCSGTLAYARQRLIDYRTGLLFAAATVPASFGGAYMVRFLPRSAFDVTFGAVLAALAAYAVYGAPRRQVVVREPLRAGRALVVRSLRGGEGVVYRYAYDARRGLGLSGAIGFASSLFGVGGGVIQVPVMVTLLRFPIEVAVATSQFMLIFISAAGTTLHAIDGQFAGTELARAALLSLGAVPGAQAGARLSRRLERRLVAPLLALGLVIVATRLVLAPVF